MRKHGEEIVFRPIGGFDLRFLLLDRQFGSSPFRHGGGKRQGGDGEDSGLAVHDEQGMIVRFHDEGPVMVERPYDRDGREQKNSGGRFTLRKTKCRPDDNRSANKRNGIILCADGKPAAENNLAEKKERKKKKKDLVIPSKFKLG